jgi:amino acid transporter
MLNQQQIGYLRPGLPVLLLVAIVAANRLFGVSTAGEATAVGFGVALLFLLLLLLLLASGVQYGRADERPAAASPGSYLGWSVVLAVAGILSWHLAFGYWHAGLAILAFIYAVVAVTGYARATRSKNEVHP